MGESDQQQPAPPPLPAPSVQYETKEAGSGGTERR